MRHSVAVYQQYAMLPIACVANITTTCYHHTYPQLPLQFEAARELSAQRAAKLSARVAEERDKRCAAERQRRLEREGVARDVQQLSAALRRFEAYGSHFVHTTAHTHMHQYSSSSSSGGCANSVSLSPRRSTRQPPLRQQQHQHQQQQQQQQQLRGSARSAARRRCPPGWARDSSDADSQGHVWSGLAATEALLPGALEQEVAALKSRLTACLSGAGPAAAGTQQQTVLLQHSSALQHSDAPKCDSPHTQHSDADDEHEEEAVGCTAAHSAVDSVTGSSGSDSELHAEVVRLRDRIASLRERREQLAAAEATRDHSTAA
jgi:hypothetical protein